MRRFGLAPQTTRSYLILALLAAGCAKPPEPKAPTSEKKPVTFSVPKVIPTEEGAETKERGGLTISVVPNTYEVKEREEKSCIPVSDGKAKSDALGGLVTVKSGDDDGRIYELRSERSYSVEPDTVSFTVQVTNRTGHRIKLGEVTPRLIINNRQVPLRQQEIDELTSAILLDKDAFTFTLFGPKWDPSSDRAVINFRIAEIPIETDAAGVVTQTDDIDWTYTAEVEQRTVEVEKKTEQLKLSAAEAQQMGCPVGGAPDATGSSGGTKVGGGT